MQAFRNVVKIGLAGLFLALSSPNASAHTELVSSNPAANSIVTAAPKNISLVFSEAPILTGSYIQVEQAQANLVANPKPVLAGNSLIIPWPAAIAPGQAKVNWRSVADDGHVEAGSFEFTYQQATASPSPEAVAPSGNSTRDIAGLAAGIALIILITGLVATTRSKK